MNHELAFCVIIGYVLVVPYGFGLALRIAGIRAAWDGRLASS